MIQPARVQQLNDNAVRPGRYVLYWMQQSQREDCNHALEYAVERANGLGLPVVVGFGLTPRFPGANLRHYTFMLEGLAGTAAALGRRDIAFVVRFGAPDEVALELAREAALVVCDRGYLRVQRRWRRAVARRAGCRVVRVESDVVVPVETASHKEEYSAATFRPRVMRQLDRFLVPLRRRRVKPGSLGLGLASFDLSDIPGVLARLDIDRSVGPVPGTRGGTHEAYRRLRRFVRDGLGCFAGGRNDPNRDCCSRLSAYFHFGQISALRVALEVTRAGGPGKAAFIEELVVRRELAMNFACYNPRYDRYACLPDWAKKTLARHARDRRGYVYTRRQLERAETHDQYWNAAQREMVETGRMHGYMRMYWGKKVLEWSPTPEQAFRTALALNDRYELDGRDPNGCAGVAWCLGKHDRPWQKRPVFGMVRYMNAAGLLRKFDVDAYAARFGG